jgi:hypothetical protein
MGNDIVEMSMFDRMKFIRNLIVEAIKEKFNIKGN